MTKAKSIIQNMVAFLCIFILKLNADIFGFCKKAERFEATFSAHSRILDTTKGSPQVSQ